MKMSNSKKNENSENTIVDQSEEDNLSYLTPKLIYILQISLHLGTTNNKEIAAYLDCSEQTVKSNFRRIAVLLKSKNRSESLLKAIRLGLIKMK
jgi:DNA-binding NarL/FixJ family response regulator